MHLIRFEISNLTLTTTQWKLIWGWNRKFNIEQQTLIQIFKTRIKFASFKDQPILGASKYIKEQENTVGWYRAAPFSLYSQITQDITILYNISSGGQSGTMGDCRIKSKSIS